MKLYVHWNWLWPFWREWEIESDPDWVDLIFGPLWIEISRKDADS